MGVRNESHSRSVLCGATMTKGSVVGTNIGYTIPELKGQNKQLVQIIKFLEQSNLQLGALVCLLGDELEAMVDHPDVDPTDATVRALKAYEALKGAGEGDEQPG